MHKPMFLSASLLSLLAACGGGGGADTGGPNISYVSLFDGGSTEPSSLSTLTVDPTNGSSSSTDDNLDRSDGTITLAGLAGTINADRDTISFDGGGTATITKGVTEYVAFYSAEPDSGIGEPFIGTIGIVTDLADMPSGATAYGNTSGATVIMISESDLYELSGAIDVSVSFTDSSASITFSDLDGTVTGASGASAANDVAVIEIGGATITGNTLSGGTVTSFSSPIIDPLSTDEDVTTTGGFFGPGADEVAGIVTVDDTTEGSLLFIGTFVAD